MNSLLQSLAEDDSMDDEVTEDVVPRSNAASRSDDAAFDAVFDVLSQSIPNDGEISHSSDFEEVDFEADAKHDENETETHLCKRLHGEETMKESMVTKLDTECPFEILVGENIISPLGCEDKLMLWQAGEVGTPTSSAGIMMRKKRRFGKKLLKFLKKLMIIKSRASKDKKSSSHQKLPLVPTLSESDMGSSEGLKSPPTTRNPFSWELSPESRGPMLSGPGYLPTAYAQKVQVERFRMVVPFEGSATPDKSVASAFERALSPDSSINSNAYTGSYAIVPAVKATNVAQHVGYLRGLFGSPVRPASGRVNMDCHVSFVANQGEI